MRRIIGGLAVFGLFAGDGGLAQTRVGDTPPPEAAAGGPAPAAAEDFTEDRARTRIEGAGYSEVTGLQRDEQGGWRGRARRGGNPFEVSVDLRGEVSARPAEPR
jgi:hypothetical protein